MTACRPTRARRGMTLLEVIVAMTVLAVGIAGTLGAVIACMRANDASVSYSRGALMAQQVAAELDRRPTLEPGNIMGQFDDVETTYAWSADIGEPTEQGLSPVHITVSWAEGKQEYELHTYLRPHALPPALPTGPRQVPEVPLGPDGQPLDEGTEPTGDNPPDGPPGGGPSNNPPGGGPSNNPPGGGNRVTPGVTP